METLGLGFIALLRLRIYLEPVAY